MWSVMLSAAWALAPCGTPALLGEPAPQMAPLPLPPPGSGSLLRDPYGLPNNLVSDHVVLRWGNGVSLRDDDISVLAEALEEGWDVLVDSLDMPPPLGSAEYRLNVYIGDSGSGAPSAKGAGGYYWYDSQGWPMLVLGLRAAQDADYGRGVAVHELFHALQDATGSYTYGEGDPDAWFWEATAEWATGEVFPGEPGYARLVGAFAMHPHLPLNFFDYPDAGTLIETYQYGAFLFPRFLSEQVLSPATIRDAWVEPGGAAEPLAALSALLEADGEALLPTVARAYAHIATWDFDDGPIYEDLVEEWADLFPDDDFQVTDTLRASQANGDTHSPEPGLRPGHLGADIIRLSSPGCGDLTVRFDGEAEGVLGSTARWAGALALHGEPPSHLDLEEGTEETVFLDGSVDQVSLIMVPESAAGWVKGERFGLTYALTMEPADADDPDCAPSSTGSGGVDLPASSDGFSPLASGCACHSGSSTLGGAWAWAWAWAIMLVVWRRR